MAPVSKSVYITVIEKGTVELCDSEEAYDVRWPLSLPGAPILADCPNRYQGQSRRICEKRDFGKPIWLVPDFSDCMTRTVIDSYKKVIVIVLIILL